MKLKRIAAALAVTVAGATLATGWRRRAATRRHAGAPPDPGFDEPPGDEDVSAFIETLARASGADERLARVPRSSSGARLDAAAEPLLDPQRRDAPISGSSGVSDRPRGG